MQNTRNSICFPPITKNIENNSGIICHRFYCLSRLVLVCVILTLLVQNVAIADDWDGCLLCHKMPGFGVYEVEPSKSRQRRIFSIDQNKYKYAYHGRVKCRGCHSDINQIPHVDVNKVDCANKCHIRDPSSNSWYSHERIADDLNKSVHGRKKEHESDYPRCKFCHTNKPYQNIGTELDEIDEFIGVCLQCHESEAWTKRFFKHINYRARIRRTSKDIVSLCSQCHADGTMMGRHKLDVIVGFNDTFHGKAIKYGNTEVANCLNCHAPYKKGLSPHSITKKENDLSPVSPSNKLKTCRQSGCHVDAKDAFATQGRVHPSPYGLVSSMRPKTDKLNADIDDGFQNLVIYLINLLYKILIVTVVGGLGIHQILNLRSIKRDSSKEIRQ